MPENRVMYLGIVLIVAAVSLWLGAELTKRIEWTVPYVGGAGVVLVVLAWRSNSRRRGKPLHASASNAHDEAGHLRHAHIRPRGIGRGKRSLRARPDVFEPPLPCQTASMAIGYPAVCSFVNDRVDAETLATLQAGGTRLIALRSAGYNHVDLDEAGRRGFVGGSAYRSTRLMPLRSTRLASFWRSIERSTGPTTGYGRPISRSRDWSVSIWSARPVASSVPVRLARLSHASCVDSGAVYWRSTWPRMRRFRNSSTSNIQICRRCTATRTSFRCMCPSHRPLTI